MWYVSCRLTALTYSRYPPSLLLWPGGPAQHPRDRPTRSLARGPVRHVRPKVLRQDMLYGRQANGMSHSWTLLTLAIPSANDSRPQLDLPRHQARQLPYRTPRYQIRQCRSCRRFRNGQTISRPKDQATYPIPRAKEFERNSTIHVDQYPSWTRTIAAR